MTRTFTVTPQARRDVADIFDYYRVIDPRLAMRFYDAYDAVLPMIEAHPTAGATLQLEGHSDLQFRFCRPKGFSKYLIFYRLTESTIEVVRVLHGSRDLPAALSET